MNKAEWLDTLRTERAQWDALLAEVGEARAVFDQLLAGMQSLAEEDLHDPLRFAEMPADWVPWQVIASNCYEHYRQHAPGLRDWMAHYAE
jgi:hypothetical protein